MPKSYYLPADDAGKGAWLNNLAAKLPSYSVTLGLTTADRVHFSGPVHELVLEPG